MPGLVGGAWSEHAPLQLAGGQVVWGQEAGGGLLPLPGGGVHAGMA